MTLIEILLFLVLFWLVFVALNKLYTLEGDITEFLRHCVTEATDVTIEKLNERVIEREEERRNEESKGSGYN